MSRINYGACPNYIITPDGRRYPILTRERNGYDNTTTYTVNDNIYDIVRMPSCEIECVIVNGPATIVFWDDGTKTVVKLAEGERWSPEVALCFALAKKVWGSNSQIHKLAKKHIYSQFVSEGIDVDSFTAGLIDTINNTVIKTNKTD